MNLYQLAIRLQGAQWALRGEDVTPAGVLGVFYDVLARHDPQCADWLHEHIDPKPYTVAPAHYDRQGKEMAGLLISTLSDRAADAIIAAWRAADERPKPVLQFGNDDSPARQPFVVAEIMPIATTTFDRLAENSSKKCAGLQFLTATAFSQGQGDLMFPLPRNVFMRAYKAWQAFAPDGSSYGERNLKLPQDWLDWCDKNVFCTEHDLRTIRADISPRKRFSGFIGKAWFQVKPHREDKRDHALYTSVFQALSHFITFGGAGRKTTMGMGAVERLDD